MTSLVPIPDDSEPTSSTVEHFPTSLSLRARLGKAIRASYNPRRLHPPQIDPDLPNLPAIPRIAEVCRYSAANLEYSLSPGGGLRASFKLNLLIALLVAIPVVFVLPPITLALGTFATWSAYVAATAANIFSAVLAIVGTAVIITSALMALRLIRGGS